MFRIRNSIRGIQIMLILVSGLLTVYALYCYTSGHTLSFWQEAEWNPPSPNENISEEDIETQPFLKLGTVFEGKPVEVTVVSALIDIGMIPQKGGRSMRDTSVYLQWAIMLRSLHNPLVFYTNSREAVEKITAFREGLPTKIVFFEPKSTWAWSLLDEIIKVCNAIPETRRHFVSQVYPEYTTTMHAKYELVHDASEHNYFSTKYITYLDVGTYRDIIKNSGEGDFTPFTIRLPEMFDPTKVTLHLIREAKTTETFLTVMDESISLIAGCIFLGEVNVMKQFTQDYKKYTAIMLYKYRRTNSDEQILGVMYAAYNTPFTPRVQVQFYKADDMPGCHGLDMAWICLGYQLRLRGIIDSNYKLYPRTLTGGRLPEAAVNRSAT